MAALLRLLGQLLLHPLQAAPPGHLPPISGRVELGILLPSPPILVVLMLFSIIAFCVLGGQPGVLRPGTNTKKLLTVTVTVTLSISVAVSGAGVLKKL